MPQQVHIDGGLNIVPDNKDLLHAEDKSEQALLILKNELYSGTCDFQIHSTASDGTESAGHIMQKIMASGLRAFAVTDKDTMDGVEAIQVIVEKLLKLGLKIPNFIRGIELTLSYEGHTAELLAYFPIGYGNELNSFLVGQREKREKRNREICKRLQDMGLEISYEEVLHSGAYVIGRSHIADVLTRHGYAANRLEAFKLFLAKDRPAFVSFDAPCIEEGIKVVRQAGGVPVLANITLFSWLNEDWSVIKSRLLYLKECGLMGLQAVNGHSTETDIQTMIQLAKECELEIFSGSGYRGYNDNKVDIFKGEMDFSRFID